MDKNAEIRRMRERFIELSDQVIEIAANVTANIQSAEALTSTAAELVEAIKVEVARAGDLLPNDPK